ncbi:hypothetical protein SAMN05216262_10377 [Colwellia chukchiensis]|uniref:PEP-CTERM protein-sorting domain-containing protein n=1 Tax=Colwellia chukchiensis TaxID=641665 RepID=A0A1H7KAD1_9GAMM|nr:hypothetical protein [Colwellia chukchiensis]SEK83788.1 hypothetical protein SAMN05216262_10377 [Colwellia chukchiensis]
MNCSYPKFACALLCSIFTTCSQAALISYQLLTPDNYTQVNYTNPFKQAFSSAEDGFQIYQRQRTSTIPQALIDDTMTKSADRLGVIKSTNNHDFFGIVDTINQDNPSGAVNAYWQLDISTLSSLALVMDIAAMGDFESSDYFLWRYRIDNGGYTVLFQGQSDEDGVAQYQLEDNSWQILNDPMTVNSKALNNVFQTFSTDILATGNQMTLELIASSNGGSEAVAFQKIAIQGQAKSVAVNEPKTYFLLLLAVIWLCVMRSKNIALK